VPVTAARVNRTAQRRIVRAGDADARNLHDGLAERTLRIGQLRHGQLRKSRLLPD
jgi:hypothetical protein